MEGCPPTMCVERCFFRTCHKHPKLSAESYCYKTIKEIFSEKSIGPICPSSEDVSILSLLEALVSDSMQLADLCSWGVTNLHGAWV